MIHLLAGDNPATCAGCADYTLWVGVHDVLNTLTCAKCADYGQVAANRRSRPMADVITFPRNVQAADSGTYVTHAPFIICV